MDGEHPQRLGHGETSSESESGRAASGTGRTRHNAPALVIMPVMKTAANRTTILAFAAVVVLTIGVTAFFLFTRGDTVSPSVTKADYTHSPATATVEIDKAAARAYRCTVQVQDIEHNRLGDTTFIAPEGTKKYVREVTVPFAGKPYGVEVTDCVHLN
jgi:hypothetical protein